MPDPNYIPFGNDPVFVPDEPIATMTPAFSAYFEAEAGNVLRDSPTSAFMRGVELGAAEHGVGRYGRWTGPGPRPTGGEPISAETAKAMAEDAGVTVDFGTGQTTRPAAEIMIARARARAVRDTIVNAYKPSLGTSLGVSFAASLADPLNIGAAFIPFVGEARYTAWLAQASGFGSRTAIRAGVGAVEGLAGAALFEPLIAEAATQEGRDYHLSDAIRNIMIGGVLGSGLHVGVGTVAEKVFKRTFAVEPVQTPLDVIARLPEEAKEIGLRTAIADLVEGRPVTAAEMVDVMARDNADIARSISYASTLRRDGPLIDSTEERIAWWMNRLAPASMEKPVDLQTFMKALGGVRDVSGEIKAALGGNKLATEVYISRTGATRTPRGIELDRAVELAKAEGYVADREEFLAAFTSGKPHLRASDVAAQRVRTEEGEHTARMLKEAGVSAKTRNEFKARSIVGREQALIAMERARYSAAQQRIENRLLPEPMEKPEPLNEPGADPLEVSQSRQPAQPKQPTEAEALKAETMRRFQAITQHLPPEDVVKINDELARIDAETDDMNRVLDSAVACLLGN
jgi:hypothetical protein